MKQHFLLIIAVAMGLLSAFLTKHYFTQKDAEVASQIKKIREQLRFTNAVVFKKDMARDAIIAQEDIGLMQVPAANLRLNTVGEDEAKRLVGKRTINNVTAQVPVFWTDIEGGINYLRGGLAGEVAKSMRAISINVSGSASVSGQVQPNDHVDVIGTFVLDAPDRPNEKEQVTLTVLQNVTILATGKETSRSISRGFSERASSYSMVTLLVTAREAETLVACEQNRGKLTLALRNPDDLGYEEKLPTVDFKYIREALDKLNEYRQHNIIKSRAPGTLR